MPAPITRVDSEVSSPQKRMRWATRRAPGVLGEQKRQSLLSRMHNRAASDEKNKRDSQGKESNGDGQTEDNAGSETSSQPEGNNRRIYFNIPLPAEARDENGHPTVHYERNKIRTAKYTPLSFIPKNLWFQFHNVANIYFLFIIILGVRLSLSLGASETIFIQRQS